jgi:hypothetical protein
MTGNHSWIRPAVLGSGDRWTPAADRNAYEHVEALFVNAHYSWNDPLSARSFSAWRKGLREKQDQLTEVRDSGGEKQFYRLRTKTSVSSLHAASLVLRADTLRPVNGAFEFTNNGTVQVSEEPQAGTETAAVPVQTAPKYVPQTVETLAKPEDELRVLAALNSIGADAGEPITVEPDASRRHVVVSGVGVASERQREVAQALSRLANVVVRFDTTPSHSTAQQIARRTEPAPSSSALHQLLEARAGAQQLQHIVDDVLETSSSALAQAHSLWILSQKFPPAVENGFSGADRETLERLREQHASRVAQKTERLKELLAPLLGRPRPVDKAASVTPRIPWQAGVTELLASARSFDQLLNQVLAGTDVRDTPENVLAEVSDRLEKLSNLARSKP